MSNVKTSREVIKGSERDKLLKTIMKKGGEFRANGNSLKPLFREIVSGRTVKYTFSVL